MSKLADLIAERRSRIEAFETDTRDNVVHDISVVSDLIERMPIADKRDALAGIGPDPR